MRRVCGAPIGTRKSSGASMRQLVCSRNASCSRVWTMRQRARLRPSFREAARFVGNADLADFNSRRNKFFGELVWGHDNIGIGLLQALARGKPSLLKPSSEIVYVPPKTTHLVVCELGD